MQANNFIDFINSGKTVIAIKKCKFGLAEGIPAKAIKMINATEELWLKN